MYPELTSPWRNIVQPASHVNSTFILTAYVLICISLASECLKLVQTVFALWMANIKPQIQIHNLACHWLLYWVILFLNLVGHWLLCLVILYVKCFWKHTLFAEEVYPDDDNESEFNSDDNTDTVQAMSVLLHITFYLQQMLSYSDFMTVLLHARNTIQKKKNVLYTLDG